MSKGFRHFRDLPLFGKISIVICVLALALSTMITLTSVFYYQYILSNRLFAGARSAAASAASTIDVNYNDILKRFVSICGTTEFSSDLRTLSKPYSSYTVCERLVQEELADLTSSNYLIHSALILQGDGSRAYSLYRSPLSSNLPELFSAEELHQVHGITWLTERKSPLRGNLSVIPILFPISLSDSTYVEIDLSSETPDAYAVLYLDSAKLSQSLALSSSGLADGSFYLVTNDGQVLNDSEDGRGAQLLERAETSGLMKQLSEGDAVQASCESSLSYLTARKLSKSGLTLLSRVPREPIQNTFSQTGSLLLMILTCAVGVLLVISFLVTRYITRPVKQLVSVVRRIEENTYLQAEDFGTQDEMGQLCSAINRMYATIQRQMERIKQEESEKYLAEIRLLTEQINPHFLYNTLDCIQSEVKRGETETAANMIQYLAEYMRIGLSGGADRIPFSSEIRHANAYIRLMNQRFGQSIMFMYHLTPELGQQPIIKTILQPLVENSIKHGFGIDAPGIPISVPTIEVTVYAHMEQLIIKVSDNGSGFDPGQMKELLHSSDPGQTNHVGLRNVYQRLGAYYGADRVIFEFSSIPYYCNSITIRLPLP